MRDGLYTISEAAALIGVSKSTLVRRIENGEIAPDRTDKVTCYRYFKGQTLEAYKSVRYQTVINKLGKKNHKNQILHLLICLQVLVVFGKGLSLLVVLVYFLPRSISTQ